MQLQLPKAEIIKEFKRNGYNLDNNCLKNILQFLAASNNQQKSLKGLLKKLNQISINSDEQFSQKMVKIAIQILDQGAQSKFKTYDEIIEDVRKWSIMYLSPYETNESRFFIEKPEPYLFKFEPHQQMQSDIKRFKEIEHSTKQHLKNNEWFIGMLYEDFTKTTAFQDNTRSKLILQNEANQLQIIFPENYEHQYSLVPGCIYAVKGKYLTKNLVLTVQQLILPPPLGEQKMSLMKMKFKKMCENINASKEGLNFESKDFYKYSTIYNQQRDLNKCTLIFGSVKMTKQSVQRILRIVSQFGSGVQCLILMLDASEQHEQIDLKIWLKGINTFIVPHLNSQGPRLLPKVPILKNNFNATKVLTNPAKFSIYSKESMFLNLPLMKSIYQKNLFNSKQQSANINQQLMAKSIAQLLFSQGTTKMCADIYPKQSQYFKIKQETIVFVSDKACPTMQHSKDGKKCMFVSVGNFQRDGQFVCYMPKHKKSIQLCEQPKN